MILEKAFQLIKVPGRIKVESAIENLARLDEALFLRVRMKVQNHLVTAAIALPPFRVKMRGVFLFSIGCLLKSQSEMAAVTFEVKANGLPREITGDHGITRQHTRAAILDETGI